MRAFAIMAVISIHVSGNYTFMSPDNFLAIVYMAIGVFSGFAVPLFIGISGFVLYNKYPEKIDLKKFYQKRLMSVLPPYIIFSTIYLGFECMRTNYIPIQTIAYKYLTGGWNYSYWFFIIIIQFYLLYPVIIRIYHYGNSRGRVHGISLLFHTGNYRSEQIRGFTAETCVRHFTLYPVSSAAVWHNYWYRKLSSYKL